jgi:Domain of Unknown Function (DUF1080)
LIKSLFLQALALIAAVSIFAGEPNSLTAEEKAAGWKLLFDGQSTAGWVAIGTRDFPAKGWSVRDGTLHHEKGGGGGDLVTAEQFENFEFAWEWKIGEVGNSGVKYNLVDPAKDLGFEYQLLDDARHPDGIRGGALHQTAGLYDLIAPAPERKVNPVGAWNESRLLVDGHHVEQWLNGVKTVAFEIGSAELQALIAKSKYQKIAGFGVKKRSPLLLQDHGDEITFRSLKIRVLPSK